jgi:hypothetical protein
MPTSTDLVTDLPADFAVFGQAVDTSMADLKGGTTGQILAKATNTDMDFTWVTNDVGDITAVTAGTGISGGGTSGAVTVTNSMATAITTAGDVIYGTGSGTFSRLGIGTANQVLKVNSGATAPEWATPAAATSGLTLISATTYSSQTTVSINSAFTSTYTNYLVVMNTNSTGAGHEDMSFRLRASGTDTTANYKSQRLYATGTSSGAGIDVLGTDEIWLGITSPTGVPAAGTSFVLMSPNVAARTTMQGSVGYGLFSSGTPAINIISGSQSDTTQFDGMTFIFSASNSGTVYIYGLAKA